MPGCVAVTVQLPTPVRLSEFAESKQLPEAIKATTRPEVALAFSVKGPCPKLALAGTPVRLIVWFALIMVKLPVPLLPA